MREKKCDTLTAFTWVKMAGVTCFRRSGLHKKEFSKAPQTWGLGIFKSVNVISTFGSYVCCWKDTAGERTGRSRCNCL